jgi:hypothetical protein
MKKFQMAQTWNFDKRELLEKNGLPAGAVLRHARRLGIGQFQAPIAWLTVRKRIVPPGRLVGLLAPPVACAAIASSQGRMIGPAGRTRAQMDTSAFSAPISRRFCMPPP